jgi:GT2 family glycosyltransferase
MKGVRVCGDKPPTGILYQLSDKGYYQMVRHDLMLTFHPSIDRMLERLGEELSASRSTHGSDQQDLKVAGERLRTLERDNALLEFRCASLFDQLLKSEGRAEDLAKAHEALDAQFRVIASLEAELARFSARFSSRLAAFTRFCVYSLSRHGLFRPSYARLAASGLFDKKFYLEQNPGVAEAGHNPLLHFFLHGAGEGRDPSPLFDSSWYLSAYPDVAASKTNPLLHYYLHGAAEGRLPRPLPAGGSEHPPLSREFPQLSDLDSRPSPTGLSNARNKHSSRSITPAGGLATKLWPIFKSMGKSILPNAARRQPTKSIKFTNIKGNFDGVAYGIARGWVLLPKQPDLQFIVEVLAGERVVARGKACEMRHDLKNAGMGSGFSGFAISLPPDAIDGPDDIRVRIAETGKFLPKSVDFQRMTNRIFGSFDGIHGYTATGWAIDLRFSEPAEVEFLVGGKVIGSATAKLFREDLRRAGLGTGVAGFRATLPISEANAELEVSARVQGSSVELDNSPRKLGLNRHIRRWLQRSSRLSQEQTVRLQRRLDAGIENGRKLSIVMPVYNTDPIWLEEALHSVVAQWCGAWELICVDDASPMAHVREILKRYSDLDPRIRLILLDRNGGIAKATNAGIFAATGDYVAFLDHDDYLEPDAVYKLLRASKGEPELIYSDETITGETIASVASLIARPAFSHDYYLSHPYFVHIVCVRRDIALKVGGWDEDMKISGDVDFVLRVIEQSNTITHVPAALYRWRTHLGSAGHQMKSAVMDATIGALSRHLKRLDIPARVDSGLYFNNFRVDFEDGGGKVGVIIPTRNRGDLLQKCMESMERTVDMTRVKIVIVDHESDASGTLNYLSFLASRHVVMPYCGPFNFSCINNRAVEEYTDDCEYVLFLNNDTEAIEAGWLERMRSLAGRTDVGVVGATLLYDDNTIQHAGVIIGVNELADHAHKFMPFMSGAERNIGFNCSLTSVRDYSAVTAACMMMRRNVFLEVGKFDEELAIGFGDTDLCLRALSAGYKILNDAFSVLYHHESATRARTMQFEHPEDAKRFQEKWPRLVRNGGDPFYNPMLTLRGVDHTVIASCNSAVGRSRNQKVVLPHVPRRSL